PMAPPPVPDLAAATRPGPASPPVATTRVSLSVSPVRPDVAREVAWAPVFAVESATPAAEAFPVAPESPDPARRPVASPVAPDEPEVASGVELAAELAEPVLPVLVADDWATAVPESPEMAVGMTVTSTDPPPPPLASATAIEPAPAAPPAAPPPATAAPAAPP